MEDNRIKILRDGKIKDAVNKMSMPAIIGLMVMAIYNIVDTMFVSWISTEATGATQVVFPLMIIASSIGLAFGIGGGSYVSRLLGKNDTEEANKTASTAFFTALVIGVVFTFINFAFSESIFRFFGANDDVMALTKQYGNYIIIGYSFSILNMVMNNLLRAEGSSKYSMIGMLIGSVLNIALDPLFIFTFGWGIAGAAIATTLSQVVTFLILIRMYFSKSLIKISVKHIKLKWSTYKEIFVVGTPTFVKQVLVSISIALLNGVSVVYGGTALLAATGIIIKITMLPMNVIFGYGQGFQPVAGYNYGAKQYNRVIEAFKFTTYASVIVGLITLVVFNLFGAQLFMLFKASDTVTELGVLGLRYYSIGMLMLAVTNTITMLYQTLGKGKEAMILSVARQGVFFIPVLYFLPKAIGVHGVLLSQAVADVLTLGLGLVLVIPFLKRSEIAQLKTS